MPRAKVQEPSKATNPVYQQMGQQWAAQLHKGGYPGGDFYYDHAKPTLIQMGLEGQQLEDAAVEVCEAALAHWRTLPKRKTQ